jgi:hypothetical protein
LFEASSLAANEPMFVFGHGTEEITLTSHDERECVQCVTDIDIDEHIPAEKRGKRNNATAAA